MSNDKDGLKPEVKFEIKTENAEDTCMVPKIAVKKEPETETVSVEHPCKSEPDEIPNSELPRVTIKTEIDSETFCPKTETYPGKVKQVSGDVSTKNEVKDEIQLESDDVNRITSLASLGPYLAKQDNAFNYDYISDIPQICKDEPCLLGIDEAGRGPVLGPMVYGISFCPLSQTEHLKTLGCADSKQLTEKEREQIFDDMNVKEYAQNNIGWAIDVISPSYISAKMLSRVKVSLNEISMDSAIGLVNKAIEAGVNIAEVYVDTVGPPDKYQAKLSALFPDFQIVVAKKADSTYPIVSAASICAKVARDHSLRVWKFREGLTATYEDFGSGYPGDPKTKAFLEDNVDPVFGFPRIVRFSWSTAVNVLKRKAIRMDFPDVEEERDLKYKAAGSIKKFMKPDENEYVPCRFFRERCLEHCQDI